METVIPVPSKPERPLPDWAAGTDPRSSPGTVERLLSRYSEPGDVVLDPFAGFGTTPVVAEAMDREAWGVEYEPDRVAHVRDRVDHPDRVLEGDARELDALALPAVDCCLTSPPYATEGSDVDPFRNYAGEGDYATYLADVGATVAGIADLLAPGGRLVLEASNLRHDGGVTTLAWDLAEVGREHLALETELVLRWTDGPRYGYDHGYALVFVDGDDPDDEDGGDGSHT